MFPHARSPILISMLLAGALLAPARAGAEACCLFAAGCIDVGPGDGCEGWQAGAGTTCLTFDCSAPQACCASGGGACSDVRPPECISLPNHQPQGVGTTCATTACYTEACCTAFGCFDDDPGYCRGPHESGIPQGRGTTCATFDCNATQACCHPGIGCEMETAAECRLYGGTPQGPGTTCGTHCLQACCHLDGTCTDELPRDCIARGGGVIAFQACSLGDCASIRGCCLPDGTCVDMSAADCGGLDGLPDPDHVCWSATCARPGWVPDGAGREGTPLTVRKAAAGRLALAWGQGCSSSQGGYVVCEGELGRWYSHAARSSCDGVPGTSETIAPGANVANHYYLVVPTTNLLEGSLGLDANGAERPGTGCRIAQDIGCP